MKRYIRSSYTEDFFDYDNFITKLSDKLAGRKISNEEANQEIKRYCQTHKDCKYDVIHDEVFNKSADKVDFQNDALRSVIKNNNERYVKSSTSGEFDDFGHSTDSNDNKTNYKYYLPDLDIDGTVEEIYTDVLHNYVTDRDALVAIQEILLQNQWNEEAKIVGYFIDEIDEDAQFGDDYNISRMKIDIANGYDRAGFEDVSWGKVEWGLDCYLDDDYVIIVLTDPETWEKDADRVPVEEFMNMTRDDFDTWVGQLRFYGDFEPEDEE